MRQKFDHIDLMEDGEEQRQAFTQLFGEEITKSSAQYFLSFLSVAYASWKCL
jgi:hypothetical protein